MGCIPLKTACEAALYVDDSFKISCTKREALWGVSASSINPCRTALPYVGTKHSNYTCISSPKRDWGPKRVKGGLLHPAIVGAPLQLSSMLKMSLPPKRARGGGGDNRRVAGIAPKGTSPKRYESVHAR